MIPSERERHAVDKYSRLPRVGAANGKLHLAARILANMDERRFTERLLEERRW
jgi:hypothetical protein